MIMPGPSDLDLPHIEKPPERGWLPYVPPPQGEWYFTGTIDGRHDSWDLLCYPVFRARITRAGGGTFALEIGNRSFGTFYNLDAAKQRAEKEIVSRARAMLPALVTIRNRLRASPVAAETAPEAPARKIPRVSHALADGIRCRCGKTYHQIAIYAVQVGYRQCGYFCPECMPAEHRDMLGSPP